MREENRKLKRQIAEPEGIEAPIEAKLRRRVTGSFIVALLLTVCIGFLSWYNARLAADGADWVAHTYAVLDRLELTSKDVIEVETSARTFALTGQDLLRAHYEAARAAVALDEDALRHLTADNPSQQRRLDVLESRVRTALEFAETIVAKRQQAQAVAGADEILETEKFMEGVRATTQEVKAEETRLLTQRTQRTKAGRRLTSFIVVLGIFVGAGLLAQANHAVNREVDISARARAQISTLNSELEQRVEQRTVALQSEITERKQAEERLARQASGLSQLAEELARSREDLETQALMLQSVLGGMAEGLVAADEEGSFVLWNAAAERILGMGATNMDPQEWSEHYGLFLADTTTPFPTDQLPLVRALRGEVSTAEMFLRNHALAEGAWIEVSGSPRKDKDGVLCGGVVAFRDITQRKADEREIKKLNDELERRVGERTAQLEIANKELEAFSYSVSHDLRAPLRHISGFSQLLMEEFGSTLALSAQQYLERIQAGAQKMGVLVDELLNLARVGRHALRLQPTRLNAIVAEAIAILQPDCEGRQVEWMIADLPTVACDPVLVKQIFQNLLANALKFTRPRARAAIEVRHNDEDGLSVFMVRDNGVGFNMKYIDKLFGVFQRLHRAEEFEGTGIGLVTVQRIVRKHGGEVWAEGELDKGAAFYFTLGVGKQTESKNNAATAGGRS